MKLENLYTIHLDCELHKDITSEMFLTGPGGHVIKMISRNTLKAKNQHLKVFVVSIQVLLKPSLSKQGGENYITWNDRLQIVCDQIWHQNAGTLWTEYLGNTIKLYVKKITGLIPSRVTSEDTRSS